VTALHGRRTYSQRRFLEQTSAQPACYPAVVRSGLIAVALGLASLGGCGGNGATTPSTGRWIGAERIDDVTPNGFQASRVGFPALGIDGSGRAIVVWGQDFGIRSRQFVPGRGWGPTEALPTVGPGVAGEPLIADNQAGTALVVWWQSERSDGGPTRAWSSRRGASGGWTAPEVIAGSEFHDSVAQKAVALDAAGNGIVLWTSDGIVAARSRTDQGWLSPERLSQRGASPVVAVDFFGRALATWSESDAGVARQYIPGGGWSDAARFGPDGDGTFNGPGRVAFDSSGRAVLVWERGTGGEFGPAVVWAARFDGRGWSGESVISDRAMRAFFPAVALDSRGALAIWTQFGLPDASDDGIVSSHLAFGSSWESPRRFWAANLPVTLELATNLNGEAVAAWAQVEATAQSADLPYRLWASRHAGSEWTPAAPLQAGPGWAQSPVLAVDADGNAIVAWVEHVGANATIWVNRFEVTPR
jgi:hypothetical protein